MSKETGLMIFMFLVCVLIFSLVSSEEINENPKIVIVGAGASGIAAASKLFENGFNNVTILEAEDRIGGRVYTTSFGNYSVDLGGQWVHGQTGNVAYELAEPLNLLNTSDRSDFGIKEEFFDSLGTPLSSDLTNKLTEFLNTYIYDIKSNNKIKEESVGEYAEKKFDEHFKENREIINNKKKYLRNFELMRIALDPADSWYDISTIGGEEYKVCPGDQIVNWKKRGYSTILDLLMKRYPDPNNELPVVKNTILNSEVSSIDYSNTDKGVPISISTTNGQIYEADHVIITVSLGVLKEKQKTLFIPSLPAEKVAAIEGIGFGNVAKIFFLFNDPFWDISDDRRSFDFNFMWNDAEREKIQADPEKKWLIGMYGAMTVEYKPNLLELWVVGECAREMEMLPEDKVFKHAIENLHRFLDKKYNVSEPVAMLRTRWYTNPHFRGTYSYRSVETQKKQVYAEMLEKPITLENPVILFAGEATSTNRFSTVDGAIGSGWKAANRLIEHYKPSLLKSE